MKWGIRGIFIVLLAVNFFIANANAALVDNGNGTITDTTSNLMWLKDANYWVTSGAYANLGYSGNWIDATDWADQLNYAGFDDWRLPSAKNSDGSGPCLGFNCINSELGNLYYTVLGNQSNAQGGGLTNSGSFINVQVTGYWTGTGYFQNGINGWLFDFNTGYQLPVFYGTTDVPAWAVRDVTVVPEPISSILFVTGGSLLAGRRLLRRKA